MNESSDEEDADTLAGRLACEYGNRIRRGEKISKEKYRRQLHTKAGRDEFDLLIGMDELCGLAVDYQVRKCQSEV